MAELVFGNNSGAVVLTALYVGTGIKLVKGTNTELKFNGNTVTGDVSILRALARLSNASSSLLGEISYNSSASVAEVDEIVEASIWGDKAKLLSGLEKALTTRTYVAGTDGVTIADIAAFNALRSYPNADKSANVSRWLATCSAELPVAEADKLIVASSNAKASGDKSGNNDKAAAGAANKGGKKPAEGKGKEGAAPATNIGGGGSTGAMPLLEGGEMGKVVTRFPPEPSGYLHIGHVKAVLLNDYYARAYKGKLIIRFDDTNPSKEKEEYEQNIIKDLASLGVVGDVITHTSDYFDMIEGYARKMISEGKAYMDDTPKEQMSAERLAMQNSKYRDVDVATNMARFDVMLKAGEEGSKWCLRIKMNMQDPNGTCRDPVIYRANETPHHRTGTKYKAYPTYDFACPIVDSHEGVTHALRSSEYHDRDKQFYDMQDLLGVRRVIIQDFSRLNFIYTLLSKRKLNWFVDNNIVDGWYDPRFPTVQGMLRRGLVVPALREFILSMGASKRIIDMEWDKFWATNRKHIDPIAHRYTALIKNEVVPFTLTNYTNDNFDTKLVALHPKNPEAGNKSIFLSNQVYLELEDAVLMKQDEEITLMKWGNAIVRKINKDETGRVVSMAGELHLEGDVKKTEKKVTWLPVINNEPGVKVVMSEFDSLITVPKLDEGDDFQKAINPLTKLDTEMIGEASLRNVQANEIIQLERKGYFRCDRPYIDSDRPLVLFAIPDGKVKGLMNLSDKIKAHAAAIAPK